MSCVRHKNRHCFCVEYGSPYNFFCWVLLYIHIAFVSNTAHHFQLFWLSVALRPQKPKAYYCFCVEHSSSFSTFLIECCFTSTETEGLLGTGAQDGHLDFNTPPELSYAPSSLSDRNILLPIPSRLPHWDTEPILSLIHWSYREKATMMCPSHQW